MSRSCRKTAALWRLSGLASRRFSDQPYTRYALPIGRHAITRLSLFTQLAWHGWRTEPTGSAVCGIKGAPGPRARWAALGAGAGIALGLLVAWALWATLWAALGLLVVPASTFVMAFALALLVAVRASRYARAKKGLPRLPPTLGTVVELHVVASARRGAGRVLLEEVVREAEAGGWLLFLDAANRQLTYYYRQFGFQPWGAAVEMPYGEVVQRMLRRPRLADEQGTSRWTGEPEQPWACDRSERRQAVCHGEGGTR